MRVSKTKTISWTFLSSSSDSFLLMSREDSPSTLSKKKKKRKNKSVSSSSSQKKLFLFLLLLLQTKKRTKERKRERERERKKRDFIWGRASQTRVKTRKLSLFFFLVSFLFSSSVLSLKSSSEGTRAKIPHYSLRSSIYYENNKIR